VAELDAPSENAEHQPRRVQVPTDRDLFGRPIDFVECDVEAAGQWDESRWLPHPPYLNSTGGAGSSLSGAARRQQSASVCERRSRRTIRVPLRG
jgi:hypothetical protein